MISDEKLWSMRDKIRFTYKDCQWLLNFDIKRLNRSLECCLLKPLWTRLSFSGPSSIRLTSKDSKRHFVVAFEAQTELPEMTDHELNWAFGYYKQRSLCYFSSVDVADLRGNQKVEFLHFMTVASVESTHFLPLHPSQAPHPYVPTRQTTEMEEARPLQVDFKRLSGWLRTFAR